jgi:hypothetical protein
MNASLLPCGAAVVAGAAEGVELPPAPSPYVVAAETAPDVVAAVMLPRTLGRFSYRGKGVGAWAAAVVLRGRRPAHSTPPPRPSVRQALGDAP